MLFQKEEMGEVLHEVDFNQLKIENQQYLEKIDEKNQDLLRLKLMDGNVQQILNTYKKKLHTLTMESSRLKLEIQQRNELLSKIDTETHMVEKVLCSLQLLICGFKFFFSFFLLRASGLGIIEVDNYQKKKKRPFTAEALR